MPRSVKEWIGKTDDAMPRKAVRERIWDKHKGCCHICGGPITQKRWHADHIKPLKDGGQNRESNMAPAHEVCHAGKTAKENSERAKVTRQRQKHIGADFRGAEPAKQKIKSRGFAKRERKTKDALPPRRLFG